MKIKKLITIILSLLIALSSMIAMMGCGGGFSVTFDGDGGELVSGKEVQVIKSANDIVAPVYEREGYYFEGWSVALRSITKDTRVLARWAAKKYTISFNANGGDALTSTVEVTYKTSIPELPTPTKEGYIFSGWKYQGSIINNGDIFSVASNVTYLATWTADDGKTYTITYDTQGATSPSANPTTYKVTEEEDIELVAPAKEGYEFLGWKEAGDEKNAEPTLERIIAKGSAGNLKFTAYFKAIPVHVNRYLTYTTRANIQHTSTYNGQTTIEKETINYGDAISYLSFTPSAISYKDSYWMYVSNKNEYRVEDSYKADKDCFLDLEKKEDLSGEYYYEINLYAFYVRDDEQYTVNFVLSNVVKNEEYSVIVGSHYEDYSITINYGESLGSKLVDAEPTGKAVFEEIYFTNWYYLVDKQKVKITKDTVFNSKTFSGMEVTLYPQLYPTWY